MAPQATVTLGGRTFVVKALPIAQAKAWRESLAVPFGTLARTLTTASSVEVNQFGDIAGLIQDMSGVLLGSVDLMLELMFDYSPELRAEKEWVLNNAYDEEALTAFGEVLKLAFPFGVLLGVVTGRTESKTLLNSPTRNGASALPASGPIKKAKKA